VNIKTTLKSSVAVAALFAVVAPAHAGSVSNGNDTTSVTLSGHFNKQVVLLSDGEASKVAITDNNGSRSRGRIIAKGKLNEAVDIGAVAEWSFARNNTGGASPGASNGADVGTRTSDTTFDVRHSYLSMKHKSFGGINLGWTSNAVDGIMENSLNGAGDVVYPSSGIFNGIHLRTEGSLSTANATSVTVGTLQSENVEGTRQSVIRYDSPTFAGFGVKVSTSTEDTTAASLNYGAKFAGFQVAAGVGFSNTSGDNVSDSYATDLNESYGGSIAVLHDSGINARFAYSTGEVKNSTTRDDPTTMSFGLGYKAKLTSMGSTNFAVEYTIDKDAAVNDDELKTLQIGVLQATDAGINFYTGYSLFQGERAAGVEYEDAMAVTVGAKVFF